MSLWKFALCAALLAGPGAVLADACQEEIAALYQGGALDPFAQPPYRALTEVRAPDGTVIQRFDWVVETPVRQVFGMQGGGQYILTLGSDAWRGETLAGPWQYLGNMGPGDPEAAQRAVVESQRANVSEPECLGEVMRDGVAYRSYRFRTRTDPDPARGDSWFGSVQTVFIDPSSNLLMIREEAEMAGSWAPEPSPNTQTVTYAYEPDLALRPPPQ